MKFEKIQDVTSYLKQYKTFASDGKIAINWGTLKTENFCSLIGSPHKENYYIHVAGTNGKGTVCRLLSSIYAYSGYKVGMFTSPHLLNYNERYTINGNPIPDDDILYFFQNYQAYIEKFRLSYFELSVCIALWWFQKEKVDIAIIETGLGGRLDATNVINSMCTIISSIDYDHVNILGKNIYGIAREKAGIFKKNIPSIVGNVEPHIENFLMDYAKKETINISFTQHTELPKEIIPATQNYKWKIFQDSPAFLNCIHIAMETTKQLQKKYPISTSNIVKGCHNIWRSNPPLSCFHKIHPTYPWYFDGAHNLQSLKHCFSMAEQIQPLNQWTVIFTLMNDKLDYPIAAAFNAFHNIYYYPLQEDRCVKFKQIQKYFSNHIITLFEESTIYSLYSNNFNVLFTGSLYLYKHAKRLAEKIS